MKKCNRVAELIEGAMKSLSIEVVDVSIYPATKAFKGRPFDVIIVAGYLPGSACLFTADVSLQRTSRDDTGMKFIIDGEFSEKGMEKYSHDGHQFLIDRSPVGSQLFSGQQFSINDYTEYAIRSASIADKVERGRLFFQEFLKIYGKMMNGKFTSSVSLWYVPEYSNALIREENKNGKYCSKNYKEFNSKVLSKMPPGLFPKDQRS